MSNPVASICPWGTLLFFIYGFYPKLGFFRKLSLYVVLLLMGSKTRSLNAGELAKKFFTVNIKEMSSWNNEQGIEKATQYTMCLKRNCNFLKKVIVL